MPVREIWKDVVGWKGFYKVSDLGRIKSLPRQVPRGNHTLTIKGLICKTPPDNHGYLIFVMRRNNRGKTSKVHVEVARAFHGERPKGLDVRHRDGKKANCRADNLHYGTRSQNHMDKARHGTHSRGERSSSAKLTRKQVLKIRRRYRRENITHAALAADYGVCRETISVAIRGKTWGWL